MTPRVILLAAGVGKRFGKRTQTLPKCLIPLGKDGQTLLGRYFDSFRELGLKDVTIVVGHQHAKIRAAARTKGAGLKIRFILNKAYRKGSILSLFTAAKVLDHPVLIMDADVYFPTKALARLLRSKKKNGFLCDTRVQSSGEEMMLMAAGKKSTASGQGPRLVGIAKKLVPGLVPIGESVGFLKLEKSAAKELKRILAGYVKRGQVFEEHEATYPDLMKKVRLGYEPMTGFFWTEMDFEKDFEKILRISSGQRSA